MTLCDELQDLQLAPRQVGQVLGRDVGALHRRRRPAAGQVHRVCEGLPDRRPKVVRVGRLDHVRDRACRQGRVDVLRVVMDREHDRAQRRDVLPTDPHELDAVDVACRHLDAGDENIRALLRHERESLAP